MRWFCLLVPIIVLIVSGCEKREIPVPPFNRGAIITASVEMMPDYRQQIWYSLNANKVISVNTKEDWDLAFDCRAGNGSVYINTAKVMRAYRTGKQFLREVTDTSGLGANGKADAPSGNPDSIVIKDWQTQPSVYILNMGYTLTNQPAGYYKLKLISVNADKYRIEYGKVFDTLVHTAEITMQKGYSRVMYSLLKGQQVAIEPKQTDYDLCFTQYTHHFANPFQYYQVTGVLTNSYKTRVAPCNGKSFTQVTAADTGRVVFTGRQNTIGFDWKTFDLNTNQFTVDVSKVYIVQDSRGFYYKLHFIDFYNPFGIKGCPKFEFKKL